MGWFFTRGQTKEGLIKHLTQPWGNDCGENNVNHVECTCIKYALHGNHLWGVFERIISEKATNKEIERIRWISLFLLAKERNYGYGYKDMDEYSGPYYWDCPIKFLDLAPRIEKDDESGYSLKWREGVKSYWKNQHDKVENKKNILSKIKIGTRIFIYGCKPDSFIITGIDGKDVSGEEIGTCLPYRIKPKHLAKATIISGINIPVTI